MLPLVVVRSASQRSRRTPRQPAKNTRTAPSAVETPAHGDSLTHYFRSWVGARSSPRCRSSCCRSSLVCTSTASWCRLPTTALPTSRPLPSHPRCRATCPPQRVSASVLRPRQRRHRLRRRRRLRASRHLLHLLWRTRRRRRRARRRRRGDARRICDRWAARCDWRATTARTSPRWCGTCETRSWLRWARLTARRRWRWRVSPVCARCCPSSPLPQSMSRSART